MLTLSIGKDKAHNIFIHLTSRLIIEALHASLRLMCWIVSDLQQYVSGEGSSIRPQSLCSMGGLTQFLIMQPIDWALLPRAMLGVLALLCGNGFIVGINQIYDVDVDTVNKPFLPVAAGMPCYDKPPENNMAGTKLV